MSTQKGGSGASLLQQLVNVLGVVDGSVEVKDQFRDDPKLPSHLAAKLSAQCPVGVVQHAHHLGLFLGGEYARIDFRNGVSDFFLSLNMK